MTALSYNIDETSKITGLGKTRIYEELNSGRLRAVKVGRRTLIPHASIEEWLQQLKDYSSISSEK